MCLGVPMQVVEADETSARCVWGERQETVSLALVGPAEIGQHVLVYLGSAIRMLDPLEAQQIADALEAVNNAANGESFDHLIADLIDREPQLPPHLKAQQDQKKEEEICRTD
ncbi:MAG: HypC/HybG/HupF family hydrogenase formation chaperone [Pseudomonadota bacterium]